MSVNHTILNEKYRPDTLEGYICKDEYKTNSNYENYIKRKHQKRIRTS